MLRLRPFKNQDAKYILGWIKDEKSFRKWSADRYEHYPAKEEDMIQMYRATEDTDNFYPMTAFDESGIVGHIILRFIDDEKQIIRFGFVIVDDTKRGLGYGKELLRLAIKYADEFLGAKKITLGVFENNQSALYCYKAAGFKVAGFRTNESEQVEYYHIFDEDWKCIEMEYVNQDDKQDLVR